MPYKNKALQRQAQRRSYIRNKMQHKVKTNAARIRRRRKLAALVRQMKANPCTDCGRSYPYYVMEYDHCRGEKIGNVAELIHETVPLSRLREEIAKCDLVCSNCHRERTFTRAQDKPLL